MRDRKRVDLEGRGGAEELGGINEGEIIFRMYCVRNESIVNKEKMTE